MRRSPEVLRLINHQLLKEKKLYKSVEIGRFYGDLNHRNLTIIHNEKVLHPLQPYDHLATKNQIDYFLKVFQIQDVLSSNSQVW